MRSSGLTLIPIAFLALAASPALGDTTGNEVLEKCNTAVQFFHNNGAPANQHFDAGWCFGWMAGALQLSKLHND